jgi:hypothetical protein
MVDTSSVPGRLQDLPILRDRITCFAPEEEVVEKVE